MPSLIIRILLMLVSTLLVPAPAEAKDDVGNFFVAPSVFYYTGLRSRTSKEQKDYLVYDLKVAYNIANGFFAGLAYQVENDNSETSGYSSAALNNTSKSTRISMGPSVGYVAATFHFLLTYYFDSKWQLDTTTSTGSSKYNYSGSGLQADIGYKIELGKIYFGPQLSYKKYTYGKLSTDGGAETSISPKLEDSGVEPSLVLFLFF